MKDLFYSKSEKIAFYVIGYDISTDNTKEIVKYLNKISKMFNCKKDNINTKIINESERYKFMRVFYASTEKPENAFELSESWTMDSWLRK